MGRSWSIFSSAALASLAFAPSPSLAQTSLHSLPQSALISPVEPVQQNDYPLLGAKSPTAAAAPTVPAFLLNGAVDLAQGYETHPGASLGVSTTTPDTFTRGELDLGMHYGGHRLTADAHYSGTGYYYGRLHDLNSLAHRLNFVANSELVPDHFFLNASAFAAPTTLSRVGNLSAAGNLVSNNNTQSYGYLATPTARFKIGDYAVSQTSVTESGVFFSQPSTLGTSDSSVPIIPAENTNSFTASERILSSPRFGRLRWGLTGFYSNITQTTQSQQHLQGNLDAAYAINRVLALLTTVGYGQFTSSTPLTRDLSGPTALAGFRYSTGPTFSLVAEVGTSSGFPTYLGSLNWHPTPTFTITGALTDTISTPQTGILANLTTLAASAEGVFSDAQSAYRQPIAQTLYPDLATISPVPALGLALDNSVYHNRTAQLSFVHQDERNQYGLSLFGSTRDQLSAISDGTSGTSSLLGATIHGSRKLRRDLTGFADASYSLANEFGGSDRIFTGDVGLNYMLAQNLSCYVTARYLKRQSSGQTIGTGSLSDLATIVGVRRSF